MVFIHQGGWMDGWHVMLCYVMLCYAMVVCSVCWRRRRRIKGLLTNCLPSIVFMTARAWRLHIDRPSLLTSTHYFVQERKE
jgi:hypothetical protein